MWIERVRVGRVKMSQAAHAYSWDKSWRADVPSHLFFPSFVHCFLLSLFLLYLHSPHPPISAFLYPWPYLLKILWSLSLYIWLKRHLLFPQTSMFIISQIWTEISSMPGGNFDMIVVSGWWWTCMSFQQTSFQDVWEEMTAFQGELL